MAVSLSLLAGAGWQFLDDNANPLTGGLLYTYAAGTTTPLATYTSSSGSTPNANPIVLDAAGRVSQEVWLTTTSDYKFILKNSTGVTIWTKDDIPGGLSSDAVTFLQAGAGAVERTAQSKMRDSVSVFDFMTTAQIADVQTGTLTQDVTAAIQAAIDTGRDVFLPKGSYKITSPLVIKGGDFIGEGVTYTHPFWFDPNLGTLVGTIIVPYGLQNSAAISITTTVAVASDKNKNGITVGGFGIDMTNMTAGAGTGDFDVPTMTKGVYIKDRYSVNLSDIEIMFVPSNAAGAVWHSTLIGLGTYWGNHNNVAVRNKKAAGNDPTAKGFVLFGDTQLVTAQVFTNCVSYRGWYVKQAQGCEWIGCDTQKPPKDGMLFDACRQISIVGGFWEESGLESATRTFYNIYAINGTKQLNLYGAVLAGNGFGGTMTGFDGLNIQNCGVFGETYDVAVQRVGTMVVDGAGNVTAPNNSALLAYAKDFNSIVPPTTAQSIFFDKTTAGYDIANEYNDVTTGIWTPRQAVSQLGYSTGNFLLTIQLKIQKQGGGNLDANSEYRFDLGGAGWAGPGSVYARVDAAVPVLWFTGTLPIRLVGGVSAFSQFAFYHTNTANIQIQQLNGAKSDSWISIVRVS